MKTPEHYSDEATDAARYRKLKAQPQGWMLEYMRTSRPHGRTLDAALDALPPVSPKGGSDWEATDADISAWQQRHDLAGAFGSKTDARAAFEDARSAESAAGDAEVQP
ncbi:MAG: hypothetical protein J0I01_05870 [Stenotrophomonas nitritireducens]|uniref:Uncharacterized protein n=1 Tax=Stenotrophomonas nitritireducens TaxID=83617 RepID=A0A9D8KZ05_9GAMM|nr:hypothetical protein [Stenotrophomonas nitritireducens]MBN8791739.1 hypothetical protein [Stenotrophomonas nitritireducens]MBN8795677.1 hypothetical protein [Stenotrophomonas nitritireducens]MBN8798517.1 hypothetical protein [Stenotrophomonas nitritireducens]